MKIRYDPEVDAAYIYVADKIAPGGVAHSVHLTGDLLGLHVDLDEQGRMLGIEVLAASELLPAEALAKAERPIGSGVRE